MKVVILLTDNCDPVSEASGFNLPINVKIIEGSTVTAEFQTSALVPFATSSVQMVNAVKAAAILGATNFGKVVSANDCTVVGGIS